MEETRLCPVDMKRGPIALDQQSIYVKMRTARRLRLGELSMEELSAKFGADNLVKNWGLKPDGTPTILDFDYKKPE